MSKVFTGNLELFKEFIAFCESQPVYKKINHDTWDSCAVGDYARSKGVDAGKLMSGLSGIEDNFWISVEGLTGMDRGITRIVGNLALDDELPSYPDYLEFTQFLKSYLPEETV